MGLFGFGKKKKDKSGAESASMKQDKKEKRKKKKGRSDKKEEVIKAPILFEDDEKFSKIMSNIGFDDNYSDFGVEIGETLGEIVNPKVVSDNRVKLFLTLKNYKTDDLIFKASEASQGITGKQYKIDCSNYAQQLNCKFISGIEKEVEIARMYCLDLYAKGYIEFWRMLQVVSLLGNKTDETNLRYMAIFDRLEQALIAIDVNPEKICDGLKKVIISSYNLKLKPEDRVRKQLQNFIEEISLDYEISQDTWVVIYKYLNGIVASGFKLKLDNKGIQLGYGFTIEALEIKKFEREMPETIANMDEVFQKDRHLSEEKTVSEDSSHNQNIDEEIAIRKVDPSEVKEMQPTNLFYETESQKTGFGQTLDITDEEDESVSKDFDEMSESLKDEIVGFDDYQRDLSKEDNTSGFKFEKIDGDSLIGKEPIICVKMSDMMKAYFSGDSFNAVLRQIYNLNTALNSPHGVDNCILQLCSSYNAMELGPEQLDDLMETLNSNDIDLVDFHFTNVLEVMKDVVGSKTGRVIFVLYDRIIDKTASIKKMREMCSLFESNKVIFIQLDKDVPDNFEELHCKEETLFTNCKHILATKELVCDSIILGTELRNAFFS